VSILGIYREKFLQSYIEKGLLYSCSSNYTLIYHAQHHFSHHVHMVWVKTSPSAALEMGREAGLANHSPIPYGHSSWFMDEHNLSQNNQRK